MCMPYFEHNQLPRRKAYCEHQLYAKAQVNVARNSTEKSL